MSAVVTVDSRLMKVVLDRIVALGDDMSPLMSAVGQEMENRVRVRFETQRDPLGNPWAPWKPSTVNSYPKNGNKRLLDRFGDMLQSTTHTFDENSAIIGFGDPTATYHEWGTKRMERRGLLFADPDAGTLAPDDEATLLEVVTKFLESDLDK